MNTKRLEHADEPWRLFPRNDAQREIVDERGARIALVMADVDSEGTARLMAAAPELYACLFEAIQEFPCWKINCGDPACIATRAREALARADGRKQ